MESENEVEILVARAQLVRESLDKSKSITDTMVNILGSFDQRLSSLESAMRPTQVNKQGQKGSASLAEEDQRIKQYRGSLIRTLSRRRSTFDFVTDEDFDDVEEPSLLQHEDFVVRTHAIRKAHENIDATLKAAETILFQFDVSRQVEAKVVGPIEDLGGYLAAVDQLLANVEFFSQHQSFKSSDGALNHSRSLLLKALTKLEDKFKQFLIQHSKLIDPGRLFENLPNPVKPSISGQTASLEPPGRKSLTAGLPVLIPPRIIPQLNEMAQRIVKGGHGQQCLKIYRDVRASVLEENLQKVGVEKISKEEVQKMQWEVLEGKIGNWIRLMRVSIKILFASERKICDQIFSKLDPYRERSFAEVIEHGFSTLLSSGEAIVKSKRSPEKLFVLLDMYETMRDLLPEIKIIFTGEFSARMQEMAVSLTKKLSQTSQDTFNDFLEAVEKDATKTQVQDGTVHPLTSYVINYVKFLFDYQNTLRQLFGENTADKKNTYLASATMKILQVLQANLDGKSKQYKDPALTQIFLMNNIHYIVRSVRKSEAKDLLGDDWVQRHRRIVQQHATSYQRAAWQKVLQCLSGQGLGSSTSSTGGSLGGPDGSSSVIPRGVLKERFKNFNTFFEELHQRQSQWTIPESELREAVRLAIAEVLLPAYRSFLRRYSALLENGKNPQKYLKYTPEDLERLLGEFFEGKVRNDQRR